MTEVRLLRQVFTIKPTQKVALFIHFSSPGVQNCTAGDDLWPEEEVFWSLSGANGLFVFWILFEIHCQNMCSRVEI